MTSFSFSSCCNLTEFDGFFLFHVMYSVMYNFLKCLSRVFEEKTLLFFTDRWWVTIPNVLNSNFSSVDAYQCNRDKLLFLFYFLLFCATDSEGVDSLLTNTNFHIVCVQSNLCWILFSDVVITFFKCFF